LCFFSFRGLIASRIPFRESLLAYPNVF
jgi:hypothetical protein